MFDFALWSRRLPSSPTGNYKREVSNMQVLRSWRVTAAGVLATLAVTAMSVSAASAATVGGEGGEGSGEGQGQGSFVIGDANATLGASVTFWGAQWSKLNTLTGGSAPASFKGFADSAGAPPTCGESWSTRPGNSSKPPQGPLPSLIEVSVAGYIGKAGSTVTGETDEVALVETEPGYAPNPGHAGTGTVLAILCGGI
jgi:hypothetical protein